MQLQPLPKGGPLINLAPLVLHSHTPGWEAISVPLCHSPGLL